MFISSLARRTDLARGHSRRSPSFAFLSFIFRISHFAFCFIFRLQRTLEVILCPYLYSHPPSPFSPSLSPPTRRRHRSGHLPFESIHAYNRALSSSRLSSLSPPFTSFFRRRRCRLVYCSPSTLFTLTPTLTRTFTFTFTWRRGIVSRHHVFLWLRLGRRSGPRGRKVVQTQSRALVCVCVRMCVCKVMLML
ncbi:hypothetical protein DENSPDRAFT_119122 [Dentipellis sp. KUC8613]|nr:hypothetical protein DENSPDRAFT_119122 [Dentipellis sp. KUC8613]